MAAQSQFGARRIYYNNFAEHLQNAYNPNMLYPSLPNRWSDADWHGCIDMIAAMGFNVFEFWLVPRLFCRSALAADFAQEFTRQMNAIIDHAHARGVKVELLCSLATVGDEWVTLCPNVAEDWSELRFLWQQWLERLGGVDIVGIFPGDPGACSRNGCSAQTYIDRSVDIAAMVKTTLPEAEVELHTWGSPFFGWGLIQGPPGWKGEFLRAFQSSGWTFDKARADASMRHLLARLGDFPPDTSVAINMGFNPDGNPIGDQDARPWIGQIAASHRVHSWDFSLTEGENAILPHWRFDRLFAQRRRERADAPYSGGICFTMTPRLNQLTLFLAAQSFTRMDERPEAVAGEFLDQVLGPGGREIVPLLPLFEVVKDWGNYQDTRLSRGEYHAKMRELKARLEALAGSERDQMPIFPSPMAFRQELLFFADLFADLSAPAPDYDALAARYWTRVYAIYDHLGQHVDPRPRYATKRLVDHFAAWERPAQAEAIPGKWSQ